MILHKRIGVIAGKVFRDINRSLICGILEQAYSESFSVNVFTLTEEYYDTRIDKAEQNILNVINLDRLDGIIYLPHTFASAACRELVYKFLCEKASIPVVCADHSESRFTSVWYDEKNEARDMVRHLINEHGCRRICCLTGPENSAVAHKRLNGYKDAMEEAGLEYSDDDIIFGDFWIDSAHDLAMEFIENLRPMPDAVACANDCMAISLCDTLMENGISVPDDILITGYDGTMAAALHVPSITTYKSAWKQLGAKVMCALYKEITGNNMPEMQFESGNMVCGESCGCSAVNIHGLINNLNYEKVESDYQDSSLSTTLFSSTSYREFISALYLMAYLFLDFSENDKTHYCLCLCEDWNQVTIDGSSQIRRTSGYSKRMCATDVQEKHVIFPLGNMLPDHILKSEPSVTYFTPCHFMDRCFGYNTLTLYGIADSFDMKYMRFCREVSNALAFITMQDTLKSLAFNNQVAKVRDLLTGLYNLGGFPHMWQTVSDDAQLHGHNIFMITVYVGGLRHIEEISGSLERDKLLVAFSELLMKCCTGREKILRIGNEDFAVIGSCQPLSEEYSEIIAEIENRMSSFQEMSHLYLRIGKQLIDSEKIPDTSKAQDMLIELADSLNSDQPSRNEQLYYRQLVVLRREIYQFPEQEWNLSICSEKLNISVTYFQKIYKKTFGITCMQDIQKSKLDHAKKLLTHTNDTLQTIAEKCGYDYSHFMRLFKKENGITPTDYRKGRSLG